MISREEVDRLAELARLDLSEDERDRFGEEISVILDYVDAMQSMDVTESPTDLANLNLMREDEITNDPGEFTDSIVREMPESDGGSLKIHKILGDTE